MYLKFLLLLTLFFNIIFLEAKELVFGVVPQQSPSKLIKNWTPVINYLSENSSEKIVLRIEKSIPEFERKLYNGEYDIAYMNPYHYVVANKMQNYNVTLRSKKNIVGILVAKEDIKLTPDALKGKVFLFPAPFAFAATLLTKYELKSKYGFNVEKESPIHYVNSHDSVYKGVARGIGDIGGGIKRTFKLLSDKDAKQKLKIIYKTNPYPSHPIAFHPKVAKEKVETITKLLLQTTPELLKNINIPSFIQTDNAEYDSIRDLTKSLEGN